MNGFANETAYLNRGLICHFCIYLKLSVEQNHIKVLLYCRKSHFVMYRLSRHCRVNVPVRGSRPCKSYLAQIFQSMEQMLGKFSILGISTWK